jgi:hypothetical protein
MRNEDEVFFFILLYSVWMKDINTVKEHVKKARELTTNKEVARILTQALHILEKEDKKVC